MRYCLAQAFLATHPLPLSPTDPGTPEAVGEVPNGREVSGAREEPGVREELGVAVPLVFDGDQLDTTNLSKSSQFPLSSTFAMVTLC